MKKTTLCFCVKDEQILLAMKKRGFGAGKWNGYGGKVEVGETSKAAAVRELMEESGLKAHEENLEHVAIVNFYFDKNYVFICDVFLNKIWKNTPIETEEMSPKWYKINELPFLEMWAADAKWLPLILEGQIIEAEVFFNSDGSIVEDFKYKRIDFASY